MGIADAEVVRASMHKAQSSINNDRVRRLLARANFRSMLVYLALGALLIITILIVGREIVHHIKAIELWIASLGPWSVFAFITLFVLATSFLFPETLLAVIAGALFGLPLGLAAIVVASLLAAALQFFLSQHFLRRRIQRVIAAKPSLAAIQRAVLRDEFRLQVLLRLTLLNPATISYLLGATGVRFGKFLVACLSLTPNLFIEVYFGHASKHLVRMVCCDVRTMYLYNLAVIGGLVACVILVVIVSRVARKAVLEAVSETATEPGGAIE
jgi:uncharacterized membrane protein YdjX (TVP38/TMEM64 family)